MDGEALVVGVEPAGDAGRGEHEQPVQPARGEPLGRFVPRSALSTPTSPRFRPWEAKASSCQRLMPSATLAIRSTTWEASRSNPGCSVDQRSKSRSVGSSVTSISIWNESLDTVFLAKEYLAIELACL